MKKHLFLLVGFLAFVSEGNVFAANGTSGIWNGLYTMPGASGNKLTVFDVSQQTLIVSSAVKKILFALTSEGLFFKNGSTVPTVGSWTKCSGQSLSVVGKPTRVFGPNSWYGSAAGGSYVYMTSDARKASGTGLTRFAIGFSGTTAFCNYSNQITTPGSTQSSKYFVAGFVPPGHVNASNDQWIYLLQRNMPKSSDALYVTITGNAATPTWSSAITQGLAANPSYFNDVFRGPQADSSSNADKRIYVVTSGSSDSSKNGLWSNNHSGTLLPTGVLNQTAAVVPSFPMQDLYRVFVRDRLTDQKKDKHISEVYVGGVSGLQVCYNVVPATGAAKCSSAWQRYSKDTTRCGDNHDLSGDIITGIYAETGKYGINTTPNIAVSSLSTASPLFLTSGKHAYFKSYLDLLTYMGVYEDSNDCPFVDNTLIQDGGVAFLDISSVSGSTEGNCSSAYSGVYTNTHNPGGVLAGTLPTSNNNRSFAYGVCGSRLYSYADRNCEPENFLVGIAGPFCDNGGADYTDNVNL